MLKLDRELEGSLSYALFIGMLVDHPSVASVSFDRQTPSCMNDPRVIVEIAVDMTTVEDLDSFAALWGYENWHEFLRNEDEYLSETH